MSTARLYFNSVRLNNLNRLIWPSAIILLALLRCSAPAQTATENAGKPALLSSTPALCTACVHADMAFLADDELHGRGSGTRDEHLAANFAASLFESFGLEPGGDHGTFIQKIPLPQTGSHKTDDPGAEASKETWNTIGVLRGSENKTLQEAILLTAHIDHLGIGPAINGDSIYNGADDDASGTTAVLELARVLSRTRPRRTILFVLFGSEETGGAGNHYFLAHPTVPLNQIVANLEFEMIGQLDPTIPPGDCWLTGFDRSDLGRMLASHGAPLVSDPHPDQNFFRRSDNYSLALQGVVAHTVSSFGLHADYHHPSDDLQHIDFTHLSAVIRSMINPIVWLANTNWRPAWTADGRPVPSK
jgi:hypothetical protein